jgi:hypothetical protein
MSNIDIYERAQCFDWNAYDAHKFMSLSNLHLADVADQAVPSHRYLGPSTRNPNVETLNPKPERRNPKSETLK